MMAQARKPVSAGLVDAATSSLATFALGLFAARLDASVVGAYALYFASLRLFQSVSNQLVFLPIEIGAVSRPNLERLSLFGASLRAGLPVAAIAAVFTAFTHFLLPAEAGWEVSGPLAVTTALATLVSPVQDHVRRMLHLGGIPWAAAVVSGAQLVAAVFSILVLDRFGIEPIWIPMGGLAFANLVSVGVGLTMANLKAERSDVTSFSRRALSTSGSWLLASSTVRNGAGVIAGALIANLATLDDLGFAEAARIFSQPLLVLATGLGFALRPRSMEAANAREERDARSVSKVFNGLLGSIGVILILIFGIPWPWNPMREILPNAYVIPGLLIARLAANVLSGVAFPYRFELQGARLESRVARTDTVSGLGQVLVALTAPWTQAFANPLGTMAVSAGQVIGYQRDLKPYYRKKRARSEDLRVLHLAQGALGSGGGPYNLRSLAVAQGSIGMNVTVGGFRRGDDLSSIPGVSKRELPQSGWIKTVRSLAETHDVVHVHGMLNRTHNRFIRSALDSGATVFVTPRSSHHPLALPRRFGTKRAVPGSHLVKRLYTALIDRPTLRSVDGIHVLSRYEAEIERVDEVPTWIHPYGIDNEPHPTRAPRTDGTCFLFLGRLDIYQKGLDILFDAFKVTADAMTGKGLRLIVAGPGDMSLLADRAVDGVEMVGPVNPDRRRELLAETDFFVHPSRWEVMARAAREALAHGVPLVASRESNFGDWVESSDMGIMTAISVDALAEALTAAAETTSARRTEMGRNALAFAQSHHWEDLAQASRSWYLEVR